jgi:hypothetical protein
MREDSKSENDCLDDSYEDSYFDDAIIEIANEIAQINAIKKAIAPPKSDPQISLKVEMEPKKAESSSTNFFRVLKTIREVQVFSGNMPVVVQGTQVTTERKFIHPVKGSDQKYHPLTITETVVIGEEISDYHSPTLEELFEDPEPEEKPAVVVSIKKKTVDAGLLIPVSDGPNLHPGEKLPDTPVIKTVNIPNTMSKNITRQLKENERNFFKNFLRMQKK